MKTVLLNGTCKPQEMRIVEVNIPKVKPG
ncbi:MAG: hypothetical protein K0Q87_2489, partial [Neobacillus sp.]|nr:hypothetical protein [Neobacillus sp.]